LASWRWAGEECSAKAVDMTLCGPHSLANANALPISLRGAYVDTPQQELFRRFGNSAGCRHLSGLRVPPVRSSIFPLFSPRQEQLFEATILRSHREFAVVVEAGLETPCSAVPYGVAQCVEVEAFWIKILCL
jgi:hypothetical protein